MPRSRGTSRKGKPKKNDRAAGMGRALTKSQQQKYRPKANGSSRGAGMAMAPGTYDIGEDDAVNRATQQSVLEMDDLSDFLNKAELAGREFVSEREQFVVLDPTGQEYQRPQDPKVSWSDQPRKQDFAFHELIVPRRPAWDETTTAEELDKKERESFLEWRRSIARKEEELLEKSGENVRVTPFEKNLEVWRQLWRVLERCSCLLQIVDGRNPLFYLNSDLRTYATTELGKPMLLVVNKSDYLSAKQRQLWHEYLTEQGWDHVFFSAHDEQAKLDDAARNQRLHDEIATPLATGDDRDTDDNNEQEPEATTGPETSPSSSFLELKKEIGVDTPLTRQELLNWMQGFATHYNCERDQRFSNKIQFGTLGFPNVGKSSVINVLVGNSKHTHGLVRVGVASQPGKTKHFQTLFLPDQEDMMLCDCPGLVFPSFVSSTADLIAAGVYPISQMRDPWPVVRLICQRIPRQVLEAQYGIKLVPSIERTNGVPSDTALPPTAEELLSTICVARSLLAGGSGIPDHQQAARIVIKDYAAGKLLYCHAPPSMYDDPSVFRRETLETALVRTKKLRDKLEAAALRPESIALKEEQGIVPSRSVEADAVDDDLDLLEFLDNSGVPSTGTDTGGKRGKSHKSMQKWGKKGRKTRNKDPYGCHSTPDDELGGSVGNQQHATSSGVVVNAGKYGRKGYTRPTAYGGARGVVL